MLNITRAAIAGMSLLGAFHQSLLVTTSLRPKQLVRGSESNDDETGEDESQGRVNPPGLKNDADVLRIPVEEHVHTAGALLSIAMSSVASVFSSVSSMSSAKFHVHIRDEIQFEVLVRRCVERSELRTIKIFIIPIPCDCGAFGCGVQGVSEEMIIRSAQPTTIHHAQERGRALPQDEQEHCGQESARGYLL